MARPTAFDLELDRIDKAIAELRDTAFALPISNEKATKFAYLVYQRASLTGNLAELESADRTLQHAMGKVGPASDLSLLKANLDFKFHRLADVRQRLDDDQELRESAQGRALLADLDFQEGRYDEAKALYEQLIEDEQDWSSLARLGYLRFKMGDAAAADALYSDAEEELTAKEMRHFAWLEVQRGVVHLSHGDYEKAWAHYRRADRAYSGYWVVDEHTAELLGAMRKCAEATSLYEKVISQTNRSDFRQALGELYTAMGRPEEAEDSYKKALAGYLDSAGRGEVHYYHHLTDFYADVCVDGGEAVKWARKDIALRRNFATLAAMAWALYRAGEFVEACETMKEALASGVRDARMFSQAGKIFRAAGETAESTRCLELAARMNPHHKDFHVHR